MCFSASASFTAAAGLALISLASLSKVRHVRQVMFAKIPALFAVQQFSEGLVWLSTKGIFNHTGQLIASYVFLTFAFIVWPTWIPLSLLMLEKNERKKKLLRLLALAGIIWSCVLAVLLARADVLAHVYQGNMCYSISSFDTFAQVIGNKAIALTLYLIPVILPTFISSVPHMWLFGVAGLVSCFLTLIFWTACFTSVWCYFAAVLSIMLVFLMPKL